MIRVEVRLSGGRSYPVLVGPGTVGELASVVPSGARRVAVVTQASIPVEVDPGVDHRVFTIDEGNPSYGDPATAPIVIVEFSEFQCPYCSRVVPTLKELVARYPEEVRVVFRHLPLDFHAQARGAALASICAGQQDKFWEYHDLLFENQRALAIADLKGYASSLSLDSAKFDDCLDSGRYTKEVEDDKKAGAAVGVAGTPAFFINGQFLNGARPFESFKELIDGELKAKGLL